jgi:uncharacterized protein (TIRG00374 family)
MKRFAKNACLLALGLGIVFFLLSKVNVQNLVTILRKGDPILLALGIVLSFMQPVLNTMKWSLLLKNKNIQIPFHHLFSSQMIGLFVSSFFPSKYSGDVYRTYVVSKYSGKTYDSAATVLLQRVSGLFVMGCLGFTASLLVFDLLDNFPLTALIMVTCLAIAVGSCIVFSRTVFKGFDNVLKTLRLNFLRMPAEKLHKAVMEYKDESSLIIQILFLSLLFYIGAFVIVFIGTLFVGANVRFVYVVMVVPIIYLLEALPISINGFGVREGAFTFFFMKVGVSMEQAFAIAVFVLLSRLIKALTGGVFFLFRYLELRKIKGTDTRIVFGTQDIGRVEG